MDDNVTGEIGEFYEADEESAELILAGLRRDEATQNNIYESSHLGVIEEMEKDEEGRYLGTATVRFVSTPMMRTRVLLSVHAGQARWFGGLPQAGTLCLVTWLPGGVAAVAAYYPFNIRSLKDRRGLQDLDPGEILIQSSGGVAKNSQTILGKILLDRHGRIQLRTSSGAIVTLGNPGLENGLEELPGTDTVTGVDIAVQLRVADTTINITEDGSVTVNSDVIHLGGEGKKLATEDFVNDVYNSHTHLPGSFNVPGTGAVVGISASPGQTGTDSHLTDKTKAE